MSKPLAVVLCRISDPKQEDGYSLDAQEQFGLEYCQQKGFKLAKLFRFVETGSKVGRRHKFDDMMDFLKDLIKRQPDGHPVHLIVEKPDRLTRNFTNREQMQFFVMLGKLVIHYYKDRRIMDQNCSPADIFTDDMMTSVSKYMALNTAREVKKGMNTKASEGWYPGRTPIGYKYVRDGAVGKHGRKEARIVVDQDIKGIVYRIFELRAVEKRSYEAISNKIRDEFKERLGDTKYKFNKSSIEKILLHPFYGGSFEWGGKMYVGHHELFVPPSWVELAQGKMRGTPNKPMPLGPFSRFLTCAVPECGCQIIYDPKKKVNKRNGAAREYHYYHCSDGKGVHKRLGIPQVNVAESRLWEQFEGVVRYFSLPPAVADMVALRVNEQELQAQEGMRRQHREAKERLDALLSKQDRLYEDMTKGLIDEEDHRRMREKIRGDIQALKLKLENNYEKTRELVRERLKSTLELATSAEERWNNASPSDRVVLLRNVLSNFSLEGATVRYDLRNPFRLLAQIKNKGVSKNWCARGDLNPHAVKHMHLKHACLPVPPPAHTVRNSTESFPKDRFLTKR